VWAWQGKAVVWPRWVLRSDRYGPRERAAETGWGKLFHGSFVLAKRSLPGKVSGKGKK